MGKEFIIRRNHADALRGASGRDPVQQCPPDSSCEDLWRKIDEEVKPILAIEDPLERNRKISAAYASMHQRKPDYDWIGLAAIVSRQAGCNMQEAKGRSEDLIGGGYAKDAFDGLAEANKEIFKDIYPVMRFAESNGAKKLRQCSGSGGRRVPEELLKAAEQIEKGTPEGRAKAADMIADYEQRTVVPEKVYSVERFKNAFAANEYWSGWFFGSWFGAKKPALALSSECGKGTPIPLNGSILNADDRVNYYQKLMAEFKKQDALWKKSIMGQIKAQGQ